jgi:hypothetical protein
VREENPSGSGDGAIRVADGRFFAPSPVERVQLLGSLDDWRTALSKVGIQVVDNEADLVVCEPRHVREAAVSAHRRYWFSVQADVPCVGPATSRQTLLVRPGSAGPRLYVPVEHHSAVRVALLARAPGRSAVKRLATVAVVTALRAGVPLPGALTFASRSEARPRLLTATLGAEFDGAWYLLTGEGDDLQRLVWFCFDGSDEPTHVVKFSRVAGNEAAFDREAHSLRALEALPPALRRHAPGIAGRESVDGLPVTVETAVPGRPLHVELAAGRDCTDVVAAIADWIVDLGRRRESTRRHLPRRSTDWKTTCCHFGPGPEPRAGLRAASRRSRRCSSTTTSAAGTCTSTDASSRSSTGSRAGSRACPCGISCTS